MQSKLQMINVNVKNVFWFIFQLSTEPEVLIEKKSTHTMESSSKDSLHYLIQRLIKYIKIRAGFQLCYCPVREFD